MKQITIENRVKWTVYIRIFLYTVMSVDEVVKQLLSCCYVAISFTAVCTIPVIGGVELGMVAAERIKMSKGI